eukprot:scaffold147121_cov27-Tisochrysis_lutea.AAC.1
MASSSISKQPALACRVSSPTSSHFRWMCDHIKASTETSHCVKTPETVIGAQRQVQKHADTPYRASVGGIDVGAADVFIAALVGGTSCSKWS